MARSNAHNDANESLNYRQFVAELDAFAQAQRDLIDAECDAFSANASQRDMRVSRSQSDYQFFVNTYFPHYIKHPEHPSAFHQFVFDAVPASIDAKAGARLAMAAPRGEAKSTLVTQLFALWCIVTKRKHFIVLIMDSYDQAAMMLEAIKVELESNPRLLFDYAAMCGAGRVWRNDVVVTSSGVKIQVAGTGKKIRGWRHGAYRPDLVLLDDIENDENVRKKEQRDKTYRWLTKAVLKLGPPDGSMDVIYLGTLLHYDSVLNRILKNPLWRGVRFKAIVQMPTNMDLWEQWQELLINNGENGKVLADAFYSKYKKKMLEGAIVSWPKVRPLKLLMEMRAEDLHAFDCEMQNDPTNDESCPFKIITFWVNALNNWVFYGACDPSLGKRGGRGDPSAILVGGINRETGILDVVEASIKRRVSSKIIDDVIELQRQYNCMVWGIETIQFQEFLRTQLIEKAAHARVAMPARGVTPSTDKALRIESLQPHVLNGQIRIHQSQHVLYEQLRHWPEADHDDGPDALHMLWMIAITGAAGVPKILTAPRNSFRRGLQYD